MKPIQIVIAGRRATGKSELIKGLLDVYGQDLQKISAGSFVRDLARRMDLSLEGADKYMLENLDLHRQLDLDVLRQCQEATSFVVDWRMGAMFSDRLPNAVFVRLDCDHTARVIRYARRQGILYYGTAEKALQAEEAAYDEAMGKLYGDLGKFADSDFDLILNTTDMSPEEVLGSVTNHLLTHGF